MDSCSLQPKQGTVCFFIEINFRDEIVLSLVKGVIKDKGDSAYLWPK